MRELIAPIYAAADRYLYWLNMPTISKTDVAEIIIIAFILYHILLWFKNTRAWMLFRGILVILIFLAIAGIFQMNTILWLASRLFSVAVIALVVIFQPELRSALEQLGRKNIFASLFNFNLQKDTENKFSEKTVNEIVKASFEMGKVKTGALIVSEKETSLSEYVRTVELERRL